jgi:hypothetical protein
VDNELAAALRYEVARTEGLQHPSHPTTRTRNIANFTTRYVYHH